MNLDGITIEKKKGGANRKTGERSTSGLIISTPQKSDAIEYDNVYCVTNIKQIEDLGFSVGFDDFHNVNVFRHFSEFFRMAEQGTKLYFMLVKDTVSLSDILEDTDQKYAKKLLLEADYNIRQLALASNYSDTITYVDGLPQDLHSAVLKAQELALWAYNSFCLATCFWKLTLFPTTF